MIPDKQPDSMSVRTAGAGADFNTDSGASPITDEEVKAAADALSAALVDISSAAGESMQFPPVRAGRVIGLMRAESGESVYGCDSAVMRTMGKAPGIRNDVPLDPDGVRLLTGAGHRVIVQSGTGYPADIFNADYVEAGAEIIYGDGDRQVLETADLVLKAGGFTRGEADWFHQGQILLGRINLADHADIADALIESRASAFDLGRLSFGSTAPVRCDAMDIAWERSYEARTDIAELCLRILDKGVQVSCADDYQLRKSLVAFDGVLTDDMAARAIGRQWKYPEDALGISMWTLDTGEAQL